MNSLPEADLKDLKYKVNMGKPLTEEEFRAMRAQEGLPMPKPAEHHDTSNKFTPDPVIDTSDIISPEAFQKMMSQNMFKGGQKPKPSRDQKRALQRENQKREKMKEKLSTSSQK